MQISDAQVERFCSAFYAHWDLTANDVARGKVRDAILTAFAATPEPISVQNMRQEMSLLISLFKHAIATPGYGQDPASREEAEDHIDSAGRALEAALSLPVQPEDDLIAAREAAAATILAQGWSDDTAAQYRSGFYDHIESIQACLLALRSRPASALPVVGEDFEKAFQLIFEAYSMPADRFSDSHDWGMALNKRITKAFSIMQRIRSALSPTVQP